MAEFNAFSFKSLIFISLFTALISAIILSQVIAKPNSDGSSPGTSNFNSQSQTSTSTPTSSATQTSASSEANVYSNTNAGANTVTQSDVVPNYGKVNDHTQRVVNLIYYYLLIAITSVSLGIGISIVAGLTLIFIVNPRKIRIYINQSFRVNGFNGTIGLFGKSITFFSNDLKIKAILELHGYRKLSATIKLPQANWIDPLEFGFRTGQTFTSTKCDLDVLPLRLRVVNEYLKELQT